MFIGILWSFLVKLFSGQHKESYACFSPFE